MSDDDISWLRESQGAPNPTIAYVAHLETLNAEFLTALKELVRYSDEVSFVGMAVALRLARAAIAKAEG